MGACREGHLSCNQFGLKATFKSRNIAYVRGHNLHRRCVLQLQNFRKFASFSPGAHPVPETPSELPAVDADAERLGLEAQCWSVWIL
jgi:hypothetical protein